MIAAKIVADSKNNFGRITTMVVTMPRYILAEFNTHRMFSRNSASSRAIPFEKMLDSIKNNPFIPMAWMKDHKGMQGTEFHTSPEIVHSHRESWLRARDAAMTEAIRLSEQDVTKQLCNRLLEPFMWHTVIVTATDWENYFALRCPRYKGYKEGEVFRSKKDFRKAYSRETEEVKDNAIWWLRINEGQAEIHMMALAEVMWDAYQEGKPRELKEGEWHIPFGDNIEIKDGNFSAEDAKGFNSISESLQVKIATARCARISYTIVGEEGKPANYENDIKLHDRLAASGHWSPFEHCALNTQEEGIFGNFRNFIQYRKTFQNENLI